jgi:hypothetical protein
LRETLNNACSFEIDERGALICESTTAAAASPDSRHAESHT